MTPVYNRFTFKDGSKGYFVLRCPGCGYAIEDTPRVQVVRVCPFCLQANKRLKLEPYQVRTWPKYNVTPVHLPPSQGQDT